MRGVVVDVDQNHGPDQAQESALVGTESGDRSVENMTILLVNALILSQTRNWTNMTLTVNQFYTFWHLTALVELVQAG